MCHPGTSGRDTYAAENIREEFLLFYIPFSGSTLHIEFQRKQGQLISEKFIEERHPISLRVVILSEALQDATDNSLQTDMYI